MTREFLLTHFDLALISEHPWFRLPLLDHPAFFFSEPVYTCQSFCFSAFATTSTGICELDWGHLGPWSGEQVPTSLCASRSVSNPVLMPLALENCRMKTRSPIVLAFDVEELLDKASRLDIDGAADSENEVAIDSDIEEQPNPCTQSPNSGSPPGQDGPSRLPSRQEKKKAKKSQYTKKRKRAQRERREADVARQTLPLLDELTDSEDEGWVRDSTFDPRLPTRSPKMISQRRAAHGSPAISVSYDFALQAPVTTPGWIGQTQPQFDRTYSMSECKAKGLRVLSEEEWNLR